MHATHPAERDLARLVEGRPIRLLGVWAHPDDEAYLSAGLLGRVVDGHGAAFCLTATRGEAGVPADDPRTAEEVGDHRERELRRALAEVGTRLLPFLGHADGGCAEVPHETGVRQVLRALDRVRPHVVVTFGPDGITGHPDHLAVHRWTTEAWRRSGRGLLLYAVMSEDFVVRNRELHEEVGVFGDHEPVGVSSDDVVLGIDLDECELVRKRRVLAAHASQTDGLAAAMGEARYLRWWSSETFRRPTAADLSTASLGDMSSTELPLRR